MPLDRIERYELSDGLDGLQIKMRQAPHCVGFGVLTLVMLAAGWANSTGPDPGWWAWTGLWMVCGAGRNVCTLDRRLEDFLPRDPLPELLSAEGTSHSAICG